MLFQGRIYIARGPRHFEDFCNIFLPNLSEDQQKFYYLSARPWHFAIWQIRRRLLHYVHKKFRWRPEVATFRTKSLDLTMVICLNWSEKNWIKWVYRAPWSSILFNCCSKRVLLYAKMLKETENEKTRLFCHWSHFDWGAGTTWATPLATPIILR